MRITMFVIFGLSIVAIANPAQARSWGRTASKLAGAYAGAYVARRAGAGTVGQIGAAVAGGYLGGRAHDAFQSRGRATNENTSTAEDVDNGYESSGSTYDSDPSSAQGAVNTQTFNQAKEDLILKIRNLQQRENPAWICGTVCSGFNGDQLEANAIVAGATAAQAAYDQLDRACPKGSIFSDGISDSQKVMLNEAQLVCFPNHLSAEKAADNLSGSQPIRVTVTNIELSTTDNHLAPSRKFSFEVLNQLNDPTLLLLGSGKSTGDELSKRIGSSSDINLQLANFSKNLQDPKRQPDGSILWESRPEIPASQRIQMIAYPTKGTALINLPFTVEHACGIEYGRIKMIAVFEVGTLGPYAPPLSNQMIDLQMEAAKYSDSATDEFCGGR